MGHKTDPRRNNPPKKATKVRTPPSPGKQVHERLSQLEAKVDRLGEAFDQNTAVFSESFKMNEGISCSIQRVCTELATGKKLAHVVEPSGDPDWREYLRDYWLCMLFIDLGTWLKSLATEEKESSRIIRPTQEEVETHIFGG